MKRALLVVGLILGLGNGAQATSFDLASNGYLIMIRHALAPGTGDPQNFEVGDCTTQRNLSDTGRTQAKAIGDTLRAAGLSQPKLYSSQWCRCLETAVLLDFGEVEPLPAINSFFGRYQERAPRMQALREFLSGLDATSRTTILVTHQVNITAMTGRGVSSGGMEVFRLNGTDEPEYLGSIPAPN